MKVILSAVLALGLAVTIGGCSKLGFRKKTMSPEEVGMTLATLLCEKYTGCQPSPDFKKDQCIQEISKGLGERLKAKTDFKVETAALDGCKKAISGAGCEILSSEAPPSGCEFLQ